MAILDRLRERSETDLTDTEMTALIDDVQGEIAQRFGTIASGSVELRGGSRILDIARPIDTAQAVTIVEHTDYPRGTTTQTLVSGDYDIRNGGRTIERLASGTNRADYWAPKVVVTYTPIDDQDERDEVTIKVCLLSIEYDATGSTRVGDTSSQSLDYRTEREKLIATLAPRRGNLIV
ncbi:MAG: hypothetical protein KGZ65_00090 [Sphingomonadales bacterium]|nr:hypothetical protein [Sphingomonadaceae bacterium]MBS3929605.1 hypothetical protein [Sphingomonadales bacterium]